MIVVPDHVFSKTLITWIFERAIRNALAKAPEDISGAIAQDFLRECAPRLHEWLNAHVEGRYRAVANTLEVFIVFDDPRDETMFKLMFC